MDVTLPSWLTTCSVPSPMPAEKYPISNGDPAFIYALMDPESSRVRYIGKSTRPHERFQNHMNDRSNCHRSHWLQGLKSRGLMPVMVIIEQLDGAWPWQEAERHWIAYGLAHGWPLTNNTSGGDGVPDLPPETRARMAAVWKGRKHTPSTIAKLKAARALRVTTDETRARMSASQSGRVITWGDALAEAVRKFDAADQDEIRARIAAGERVKDIATEKNVHRTTISKIKKGTYNDRYRS